MNKSEMNSIRSIRITTALTAALLFLLSAGWLQARTLCVDVPRANLRAGPGLEHKITWEVNRHMPLIQVDQKGDWIKVRDVDGDSHWIFHELVSDKIKCVTVSQTRANIRRRPSGSAEKWFTVEKYTSFELGKKGGKWVEILFEGEKMYAYFTLLWPLD